jgi:predicted SPOUT superfamily RNA methylase MTH1
MGWRLSAAIPASVIADVPHLREKTGKLGAIARACSIFGVWEVLLYPDDAKHDQKADLELCSEILRFVETPQYLRRQLFGLSPNLRFTGVLPPLQTPPHDVPHTLEECRVGDVREGVVVSGQRGHRSVDAGLQKRFEFDGDVPVGARVTIRIEALGEHPRCKIADTSEIPAYWGYRVRQTKFKLANLLEREEFDLKIGTSRYGRLARDVWPAIANSMRNAGSILVAFGSPRAGLREILEQEGKTPEDVFDYFVNVVPDQQVSTVRTEEALLVSLNALSLIRLGGLP